MSLLCIIQITSCEVTIGFMGDVMLGRLVGDLLLQNKDYAYPWGDLLPLLRSTDFNVANLETTLTTHATKTPKVFNFRSHPTNVEALKQANIKLVNLANNHILDFGHQGLIETKKTLQNAGIDAVGAGTNNREAQKPVYIRKKDITFAFVGLTDNEPDWAAGPHKTGVNFKEINAQPSASLSSHLRAIKKNADFLIVSIHWGPNWTEAPSYTFRKFAHNLIDLGVDIIHGHSPHIFQGIERYKKGLIMYSTGDFLDDYARHEYFRNEQSFLFLVTVTKHGIKELHLIPTITENLQVIKAPFPQSHTILSRMQKLSLELGTFIPSNGVITISR